MADETNGGGEGGASGGAAAAGVGEAKLSFTQAELNAKMAENKRSLHRELAEAKAKAAAFEALQGQVSELLGSGLIDGVEDLAGFREKAGQTLESFKTEKQRAEEAQRDLKKALEGQTKKATEATQRYEQATIARAIADVAGPKASSVGAVELIQLKLAQASKVLEDGSVVVSTPVKDEDGKTVIRELSVSDAVAAMEAEVSKYGPLFKATLNGGAGGNTVDGVKRTIEGVIDFENLTYEKFVELQTKNPAAIEKSLAQMQMR